MRGNVSRMCCKKIYHGYVAWICPRDVLPGNVPEISYMSNRYQEYVPRICYWDKTRGFVADTLRDILRG